MTGSGLLVVVIVACVFFGREVKCQQQQQQQQQQRRNRQPNIVIFLADDVGWADVQRHDPQMRTPNLERLARAGMFLNQSYVLPTCAPTRSALLTGRWPYTIGMQVNQIKGKNLAWLNETLTLLPQTLKDLGYSTHMIGKWHLGHCNLALTPTYRGFDTFYGFYTNSLGYFNHSGENENRYDFRDNEEVVWSARGQYAPELHTARAQRLIRDQRQLRKPFFLYYAMQTAHAPYEAKQSYVQRHCSHVTDRMRQIRCGMMAAMDESIGNITDTLEREGYLDNTIILVMSDNGGPLDGGSSNWPLRGQKSTLWEGGTRSFTILSSPLLSRRAVTYPGLVHAVDWYPTFVQAAGGTPPSGLDGIQMWNPLRTGSPSPRTEMVYNFDDESNRVAIRWQKWKLCRGRPGRRYLGWYPPASMPELSREEVNRRDVPEWQLFDIEADPEERHNVYGDAENSDVVRHMKQLMQDYERRLKPFRPARKYRGQSSRDRSGVEGPGWCQLGTAATSPRR